MKIDLHMHSTASDGVLSPEKLVDWAIEKKISAIAITDHDVFDGVRDAIEYAKEKNIEIISGAEIGADYDEMEIYDVHIVGLFLDLENKRLIELSKERLKDRKIQKKKIIKKLNELGYDITFEELKEEAESINYGRPHIARILMRKYKEFETMSDVFDVLLGHSGKVQVKKNKETMKEIIEIIHGAGGVAVLAHPMFYEDVDKVVKRFAECGGDAIEADYPYEGKRVHGSASKEVGKKEARKIVERVLKIAKKYGLAISGGGDFHSEESSCEIGDHGIDNLELEKLKTCWKKWKKN